MKKQLDLYFPQRLIKQPVVHRMADKFDVAFSIRRAKVTETAGELVLELEGEQGSIDNAIAWLKKEGVRVEPVTHDAVEG